MDSGPFRMGSSSAGRGMGSRSSVPQRSEAARAAPVEEQTHHKVSAHHVTHTHHDMADGSNKKKLIIIGIIAIVVIITIIAGWLMMSRPASGVAIDASKYQAVFFTNGQVYFGRLHTFDNDYMKLTDVFYLQTKDASSTDASKNPQKTADNNANNVQLIKLGSEIHGPSDEMVVSKAQILFFENLKSDGKVASSIDQYNKSNK